MNKILKYKTLIFLIVVMSLFFVVRTWTLNTTLLMHFDQGLHAGAIWNIWHEGKLSLLGHQTDVDGLTHAPIYYWLMLPVYALFKGDPVMASGFQILLETLSLPLLFLGLKKLFNNKVASSAIILYATSYGMVSLSRWLSNVTPILPFSNLLIYLLSLQVDEKKSMLKIFTTSLVVGVITQLNAAVGVFLLPFLFWFYRKPFNLINYFVILVGFFTPALPLLIFQFRHDFILIKAFITFATSKSAGVGFSFKVILYNLQVFLKQVNEAVMYPYLIISTPLLLIGLLRLQKLKYASTIFVFLLIPFSLLMLFQRGAISFFFVAMLPTIIALCLYALELLGEKLFYFSVAIIVLLNLSYLPNIYKPTNALIPIGDGNIITIQDRKNMIDWMYRRADGKPFSIWFYSLPYYQENVWDYMLNYYAAPKYKYLPEKTVGFYKKDLKESKMFFAIYENDYDRGYKQKIWFDLADKEFGKVIQTFDSQGLHGKMYLIDSKPGAR